MSFCTRCETYFSPGAASCPACGAPPPEPGPIAALWTAELGERPAGPPVVAGDLLLVPTQEPGTTTHHSALRALSLADGSPRWQRSFEHALVSGLAVSSLEGGLRPPLPTEGSSVGVADPDGAREDYILVATASTDLLRGEGALLALDMAGEARWRWAPGVQRVSAPAVGEGVVCITADARTFLALDLATGAERARDTLETIASLSALALAGDVAYIPCRGPRLLAVGLDGATRWHFAAEDGSNAWLDKTPAVAGERLFTVLTTGTVLALRVDDGALLWRVEAGPVGKRLSPPTAAGERLFVGARDGLHALDLADGCEVWHFPTQRRVEARPLVVGDVVYAAGHDHCLYALDAVTGQERWRHEVQRRIEVPPVAAACGEPARPCIVVADRAGVLTAVARPLSVDEHEAAGHWVEAASAYATQGQFARGAQLLEDHDEPRKAAGLWQAAGERERAAEQYEAAGAWQQAIELWSALGRPLKQAEALEQHARSLEDEPASDEERATAWAIAAEAFAAEGDMERAAAYQREVARHLRQPVISVDVQHKGLVLGAWSRLLFTVHNEGYGPARNLTIRARGDQFKGQVTATRQFATIRAGHKRTDWLDVCPQAHGDSVPLRVSLEYTDPAGKVQTEIRTLYLAVARTEATRGWGQVIPLPASESMWAPDPAEARRVRDQLTNMLDDPELDALCMDHFPDVYNTFVPSMRKDVEINILMDYCRKDKTRWQKLLVALAAGDETKTAAIRKLLDGFDDPGLDAFCQDHFPSVCDKFGRGMRKDEKITLLLDHCRRVPARYHKLLTALEEQTG